jgi:D-alanyl-D-alanine carboxypeptidase (penicillin-binding protein 5/6)
MHSSARRVAAAIAAVSAAAMASLPATTTAVAAATAAVPTRPAPHRLVKRDIGGPQLASRGIVVNYPSPRARRLPAVPASAYVIADASTGQVLAARDPHGLFPPASTLKVLTAITMLPRLRPDARVVASRLAASVQPNIVGLVPGHRYKVADLFRALLLISANDAAVALIQASGSFSRGIALMNAEARHLQAYDVVAKQPNGLPAPGQVVSAYDLALIARQAQSEPAFMKYDSTLAARFPVTRRLRVTLVNQNYLLTQYRGGIGGKIGWTVRAEATYIGLARRHGVTLIVTLLHAAPLTEIHSAERLLNWGFAMADRVRPVGVLVPPLPAAARHARHSLAGANSRGASAVGQAGPAHSSLAVPAVVAAAFCAIIVGGIAWLRRRTSPGKHPTG